MLQIATGKLFTREAERENLLRGILYTNSHMERDVGVETAAGSLTPASSYSIYPYALVYEFVERIESSGRIPGALVSHTADPYLQDFSVVASFALNCVCTPDIELARRLTSGQRGTAARASPPALIPRFFNKEIWLTPNDTKFLQRFVLQLIGMPRNSFLGVMRALRTYIAGMHRIADDLELAYTLLVASVESLAKTSSNPDSSWSSVEATRRRAIDEALASADDVTATRVREAVVTLEHGQLVRRFRYFVVAHTGASYFRDEASNQVSGLGKSDLNDAVDAAYRIRSAYIHQMRQLPDLLTMGIAHAETATVDRSVYLTLHGLSRLMRHAIIEFVMGQPTLERETYDYRLERSGIVQMQSAPQYWLASTAGDFDQDGRRKLEGFLQQMEAVENNSPGAALTDIREVLIKASARAMSINKLSRRPYLALHVLFNWIAREEHRVVIPRKVSKLANTELAEPSAEALVTHAILEQPITAWTFDAHRDELNSYLNRRSHKNGLRFPRTYEAAATLDLAERYRAAGRLDEACEMVAMAVENHPGHHGLLALEEAFNGDTPIRWRGILIPTTKLTDTVNADDP